jgi:hypothetical protein
MARCDSTGHCALKKVQVEGDKEAVKFLQEYIRDLEISWIKKMKKKVLIKFIDRCNCQANGFGKRELISVFIHRQMQLSSKWLW